MCTSRTDQTNNLAWCIINSALKGTHAQIYAATKKKKKKHWQRESSGKLRQHKQGRMVDRDWEVCVCMCSASLAGPSPDHRDGWGKIYPKATWFLLRWQCVGTCVILCFSYVIILSLRTQQARNYGWSDNVSTLRFLVISRRSNWSGTSKLLSSAKQNAQIILLLRAAN